MYLFTKKKEKKRSGFINHTLPIGFTFSGLLYLIGVICFAAGWGSERVAMLCGTQSEPFVSADCSTGT